MIILEKMAAIANTSLTVALIVSQKRGEIAEAVVSLRQLNFDTIPEFHTDTSQTSQDEW
jgi:hypothetical protein